MCLRSNRYIWHANHGKEESIRFLTEKILIGSMWFSVQSILLVSLTGVFFNSFTRYGNRFPTTCCGKSKWFLPSIVNWGLACLYLVNKKRSYLVHWDGKANKKIKRKEIDSKKAVNTVLFPWIQLKQRKIYLSPLQVFIKLSKHETATSWSPPLTCGQTHRNRNERKSFD